MIEYIPNVAALSKNLKQARLTSSNFMKAELQSHKKKEVKWSFYNRGIAQYDTDLKWILPKGGSLELVNSMDRPLILYTFSPLTFVRELSKKSKNLRGGVALSLADLRTFNERMYDRIHNLTQITDADIYDSKKWSKKIKEILIKNNKTGFDLITCLPVGGWSIHDEVGELVAPPIDLVWTVVNTLWKHLAKDGQLLISFPADLLEDCDNWMRFAKRKVWT